MVACIEERAPRRWIVSPGVTSFDLEDDVRQGDTIICRTPDGDAGVVVPEHGGGVGLGSDIAVEVDAEGRVNVHCAKRIASA